MSEMKLKATGIMEVVQIRGWGVREAICVY